MRDPITDLLNVMDCHLGFKPWGDGEWYVCPPEMCKRYKRKLRGDIVACKDRIRLWHSFALWMLIDSTYGAVTGTESPEGFAFVMRAIDIHMDCLMNPATGHGRIGIKAHKNRVSQMYAHPQYDLCEWIAVWTLSGGAYKHGPYCAARDVAYLAAKRAANGEKYPWSEDTAQRINAAHISFWNDASERLAFHARSINLIK